MVLPNVALRLLAASVLITGVALAGGAMAKPADSAVASARAEAALTQPVTEAAACARKVKVVYAGYGEAERVGCAVTAKTND